MLCRGLRRGFGSIILYKFNGEGVGLVMTLEEKKLLAYEYGYEAYEQGYDRVAGLNSRVLGLVEGLGVGEGASDILWEWTKGWDSANLDNEFSFEIGEDSEI